MNILTKSLLLVAGLALAACTSPSRFDNGNDAALNGADSAATTIDPSLAVDTTSAAYFSSTVGDRVLFAVDESTLGPEARQVLTGQARWLIENGIYNVKIEGHADEQGTREYNLALGARRASAVQQFLISQGVSPSRVQTVTFGKERPLEICSEEACYAKNRRAVTVVAGGLS